MNSMKQILFSGVIGLFLTLIGTPLLIKLLASKGYGQFIRDDGPRDHHSKRGTPTMGGIAFILATIIAYALTKVITSSDPTFSGVLVLFLMAGMGLVGFLDDYIKIVKQRSLGLRAKAKMAGQLIVGIAFAVLSLQFADLRGQTPASDRLSFTQDFGWQIGPVIFVIWALFMILAMSNGVNLTDGLDGLATGASVMVFGAYTFIGIWQYQESCANQITAGPGLLRGPRSARPRGRRLRPDGRLLRLPVVEHLARQDLHGRHRLAGPGRRAGRSGHLLPHGAAAGRPRRPLRPDHHVRGHPGRLLPAHRQAGLPDGATPAPLRTQGLVRSPCGGPLLDHPGHVRDRRTRHLLRRLGRRPSDHARPGGLRRAARHRRRPRRERHQRRPRPGRPRRPRHRRRRRRRRARSARRPPSWRRRGSRCASATARPCPRAPTGRHLARLEAGQPAVRGGRRGRRATWSGRCRAGLAAARPATAAPWLAVTGTNGKTTTVRMLAAILRAAGLRTAAVGNIGTPLIDVVLGRAGRDALRRARRRALQLPAALGALAARALRRRPQPRPRPPRLARLHGGVRRRQGPDLRGQQVACVYNVADQATEDLVRAGRRRGGLPRHRLHPRHPRPLPTGRRRRHPGRPRLRREPAAAGPGARRGRRRHARPAPRTTSPTPWRRRPWPAPSASRPPPYATGCAPSTPTRTASQHVADIDGVAYVDDSKATNTHAAEASLAAYEHDRVDRRRPRQGRDLRRAGRAVGAPAARRGADRRRPGADPRSPGATRPGCPGGRPRPDRHWGDGRGGPRSGPAARARATPSCWPRPAPRWTCSSTTTSGATPSPRRSVQLATARRATSRTVPAPLSSPSRRASDRRGTTDDGPIRRRRPRRRRGAPARATAPPRPRGEPHLAGGLRTARLLDARRSGPGTGR